MGLASNDSFAPLRLLSSDSDTARAITDSPRASNGSATSSIKHDAALRARLKSSLSGRWTAIDNASTLDDAANAANANDAPLTTAASAARDSNSQRNRMPGDAAAFDEVREAALILLARHGILTREMLALEPSPLTWQTLSFALRRMEYAGTIRRGYFVRALSGEQYALPEALELMRMVRAHDNLGETPVALSAADPADPYGVLLPGCGVTREAANLIVLRGGRFVLGLTSRALVGGDSLDDETFSTALAAMMALRPKLTIETIAGVPALDSDRVSVMATMRFHSDGRSLVFDGLPGPIPARATQRALLNH
jgi:ATP-dependent helicase Lhr and Lhr-like helicase